jgi:hypothetical protein
MRENDWTIRSFRTEHGRAPTRIAAEYPDI